MPLKQDARGRWVFRYYADGVRTGRRLQVTLPPGTTHAEALTEYHKRMAGAAARRGKPNLVRLTLAAAVDEYLRERKPHLAPATYHRTEQVLGEWVARFGPRRVDSLTAADVGRYQSERLAAGLQSSTVNLEVYRLKHLLTRLVAWGWIEQSPLRPKAVEMLPAPAPKTDYFTPEEWREFIGRVPREAVPILRAALYTANRIGELCALRWEQVDLEGGRIRVDMPKVKKSKTLRISKALRELLVGLPRGTPAARVFTRPDGSPWDPQSVRAAFLRGKPRAGLTTHSIRHTAASWLAIAGTPLRTIAAILGHSQITMTFRYAHLSPEHVSEAVEVISDVENGTSGTERRHPEGPKPLQVEGLLPS
ncbi:MAG: tyrosine-type recombinase/integrase [Thermoanaerobaculia bacterium]